MRDEHRAAGRLDREGLTLLGERPGRFGDQCMKILCSARSRQQGAELVAAEPVRRSLGRYRGGELDLAHNRRAPRLLDVQLHQGARVQIKDQPRSSITMSETRRPLRFGLTGGAAPGLPTPR